MASTHISKTSDILKENLNRCQMKKDFFNSGKFKNIKENILSELSSKWDYTFCDKAKPFDKTDQVTESCETPIQARKSKLRSVYGQPEVAFNSQTSSLHHWKSLDSLDTCDSGHSLGSNSTSISDMRVLEIYKQTDSNVFASDLGTSVESSDNEQDYYKRCTSSNSTSSGCSLDTHEDDFAREAKYFMGRFVDKIFDNSSSISLEEKAKFGQYSRKESGRLWFARYITRKRNNNQCVPESTFYSLAQYFAIILFECADSDDFTPAKILMNMSFTYYHQPTNTAWLMHTQPSAGKSKQYLYMVLRDQPIWSAIRFWNAAFFDAVQCERTNFYQNKPHGNKQNAIEDWQFQANVTFGQLGTFTYNMYSFGLSKKLCLEFLNKQSTIANLTSEQRKLLLDNIEALYHSCD